ncbi:predicted protein [Naegleria gruberi]|uniref:Predicted protein n=1 Tax=Naegleria gruberi TaxID=5762 RepID=D2VWD8_NAEGR|nr:uncharacterized protein NAEGRDRAFT_59404 [Naegleria gruberi]EFC38818.1 predicted protein [Naegleria gruberi]|eukprot:XP_002671562.1 predicted protein [Naegleria gruberi strain NEG-M]
MITLYLDADFQSSSLKSKLSLQYTGNNKKQLLGPVKSEIHKSATRGKMITTSSTPYFAFSNHFHSPYDIVIAPRLNCIVVSDFGNERLMFFYLMSKNYRKSVPVAFMPTGLCVEERGCTSSRLWNVSSTTTTNTSTSPRALDSNDEQSSDDDDDDDNEFNDEEKNREDALILAGGYCHLMKVNLKVLWKTNNIKLGALDRDYTWCVGILDESGRTEFKEPSSISISFGKTFRDNVVFVADNYNHAIKIVSTVDGSILQSITRYVSYSLGKEIHVKNPNIVNVECFTKFGEVIIASPDKNNIHIIREISPNEWILVKEIGNNSLYSPFGICIDQVSPFNYKLIVSDSYHSSLKILDRFTGQEEQTFGSKGKSLGQFHHPYGLCYNRRQQEILLVDRNNSRIQVINYS